VVVPRPPSARVRACLGRALGSAKERSASVSAPWRPATGKECCGIAPALRGQPRRNARRLVASGHGPPAQRRQVVDCGGEPPLHPRRPGRPPAADLHHGSSACDARGSHVADATWPPPRPSERPGRTKVGASLAYPAGRTQGPGVGVPHAPFSVHARRCCSRHRSLRDRLVQNTLPYLELARKLPTDGANVDCFNPQGARTPALRF